ncbi:endonuclease domain-containing protein [Stakelama sediminis]|uniref:endonuclease domain-containing protein n=1 Tax=Stakelama sediminis TaxID=463200 RepID=UPI001FE594A8|nr:endonuclease domain-containing protein [Stakelama sediminis]
MTLPEVKLWQRLRGTRTGLRFRRQHPLGSYVVDFCCLNQRLAVEVDGEAHSRGTAPVRDDLRDRFMEENGFRVFRVSAVDVLRDVDAVVEAIVSFAALPLHHDAAHRGPPPRSGEE